MRGLLLVNLGTPDAPTPRALRRYLGEFLADPRVLDMNAVGRWLLLHGVILRRRPRKSARAYEKIWDERGSPLLYHSEELRAAVAEELGGGWRVALGMRYGRPGLAEAMSSLAGARRIVVLPLYPQYASSSTGSTLERVMALASTSVVVPELRVVREFYDDVGFIEAAAAVARAPLAELQPEHVLLSFHGVPERHLSAADPTGERCLRRDDCCGVIAEGENEGCYRAQCYATARALADALGLTEGRWSVAFQSRLGRTPWIQPYTDEAVIALAQAGTRRLAVLCPSFVTDCLETLEEIGQRAGDSFRAAGGERLVQIPCVNADPRWVRAVAELARGAAGGETDRLG